jgi:hypothetical protein
VRHEFHSGCSGAFTATARHGVVVAGGGAEAPVSACVAVSVAVTLGLVVRSFVGFPQGWLIESFGARWQPRSVPEGRSRPEERKRGRQAIAQAGEVRNHPRRSSRPRLSPSPSSSSWWGWRNVKTVVYQMALFFRLHRSSVAGRAVVRFGPGRPAEAACPARGPVGRRRPA